jgi:lipoate-protein ligase A
VVDHLDDWTYALVIPASHPAAGSEIRATYQALHEALGEALASLGVQTKMIPSSQSDGAGLPSAIPGKCFEEPVAHDLSRPEDGSKVAGAAMKRSREGLLLQGSVQKGLVGDMPWGQLAEAFAERIAAFLETNFERFDWENGWEKDWQQFLTEIESAAWQRR